MGNNTPTIMDIILCILLLLGLGLGVILTFVYIPDVLICSLIGISFLMIHKLERDIEKNQENVAKFFDSHLEVVNSIAKTNCQTQYQILEELRKIRIVHQNDAYRKMINRDSATDAVIIDVTEGK